MTKNVINIPKDKTVHLDLKGHDIFKSSDDSYKSLTSKSKSGGLFIVRENAKLTITGGAAAPSQSEVIKMSGCSFVRDRSMTHQGLWADTWTTGAAASTWNKKDASGRKATATLDITGGCPGTAYLVVTCTKTGGPDKGAMNRRVIKIKIKP